MKTAAQFEQMGNFQLAIASPDFKVYDESVDPDTGRQSLRYCATVDAFILAVNQSWSKPFDWGTWAKSDEGKQLLASNKAVGEANLDQIEKLLTLLVRSERVSAGAVGHAFTTGLLQAILRRIQTLA